MEGDFISALDEFFCAKYADYNRLSGIEGYRVPDLIEIGRDGNVIRRDAEVMKLCRQENAKEILINFKAGLADMEFTFNFSFVPFFERVKDKFRKYTFHKLLPAVLARVDETVQSAGEKLDIDPKIWKGIVKGKLYPEKNTIFALAIVCHLSLADTTDLLSVCGFAFEDQNVRDVIVEYVLTQKIFNENMRDRCLQEYKIDTLPIKRAKAL